MSKKSTAKKTTNGELTEESKVWTAAMIAQSKKPTTAVLNVCLNSELADACQGPTQRVRLAENLMPGEDSKLPPDVIESRKEALADAVAELKEAQTARDEMVVPYRFGSLGRKRLDALIRAHPPTPEQRKAHREEQRQKGETPGELPFNSETFPPAFISACLQSPEYTVEEATELWNSDDWGLGETNALLNTCWHVNERVV